MKPSRRQLVTAFYAAFLPTLILCVAFSRQGIAPFGGGSILTWDMKSQYVGFYASLRHIFRADNSFFYSWERLLGGNYMGLYAYYLASPFSWIICLFPAEKLSTGIVIMLLLKTALTGLAFHIYAEHLRTRIYPDAPAIITLPFTVCYATMSYAIVYTSCPMWTDALYLLPLILLGLEHLTETGSTKLLTLALAAHILFNYYTGFMTCVFTCLVFLHRIASEGAGDTLPRGTRIKRFTRSMLTSVLLAAPMLAMAASDLFTGKLSGDSSLPKAELVFSPARLIEFLWTGHYTSLNDEGLPAVFCGYVIFVFVMVFFASDGIGRGQKLSAASVIAFLLASFLFRPLDVFWHGMQHAHAFPFRYAYVFSVFLCDLALRGLLADLKEGTGFFARRKRALRFLQYILLIIAVADMTFNATRLIRGVDEEYTYEEARHLPDFVARMTPVREVLDADTDGLYRVNTLYEYTKNDAMLLGYNAMTHYASTYNAAVNEFYKQSGMSQGWFWGAGYGATPFLEDFLGARYIIEETADARYTQLSEEVAFDNGVMSLFTNPDALPVVFSAPAKDTVKERTGDDPFALQNDLFRTIAKEEGMLFRTQTEQVQAGDGEDRVETDTTYHFTTEYAAPHYLFLRGSDYDGAMIFLNDVQLSSYDRAESQHVVFLGRFEAGETLAIRVSMADDKQFSGTCYVAAMDEALLQKAMRTLAPGGIRLNGHTHGGIRGEITVGEQERVVTSIPYEAGWRVKVDGKRVEPEVFFGTFLSFPAEAGTHTVSMRFLPPGLIPGVLLQIAGIVLFVRGCVLTKRNQTAHTKDVSIGRI